MRHGWLFGFLLALLLFPALAGAQFVVFNEETAFFAAIQSPTTIEFEEVADNTAAAITDQNGAFTREQVGFQVSEVNGNPGFGQVIGRDFTESLGLGPYNLGSGDYFEALSELPVVVTMDFADVDPAAVGFRVDRRTGNSGVTVTVRTDKGGQIESNDFDVDLSGAGPAFFGFAGTGGRNVLDVTVKGSVGNRLPVIDFDRVTYAPVASVPGPAALPLFGGGLAAFVLRLRRRHTGL